MKTVLAFTAITFILVSAPVLADANHDKNGDDKSQNVNFQNNHNNDNENDGDDFRQRVSITPTNNPCDPAQKWRNHGGFISCLAHLHHDRDTDEDDEVTPSLINPTTTPSPTTTITPTNNPTETISPTSPISVAPTENASPTASTADMDTASHETPTNPVGNLFGRFVSFLIHLL